MTMESLSIFFPCHNEQDHVEHMTSEALRIAASLVGDYEVIIVDDGSTDQTPVIAKHLASENDHVKVIHHPKNKGYGAALKTGFSCDSKQWVFYTDGDGQFDLSELTSLMDLTESHDVISCIRINRQDPLSRRLNSWGWNLAIRLLCGLKVRDINCAFKLFRREVLEQIKLESKGALIDTEVLLAAEHAGFRIAQRGVQHYPRGAGKQSGGNLKVILQAFWELFKFCNRSKPKKTRHR
ncbi:MAG: cell wall biosynthesis glycosyltransferase [Phycisphaeraceae bacterium]|nr:cell wall biosynthesis glycosyltransferase [Phycisphaeraceae bacterium]